MILPILMASTAEGGGCPQANTDANWKKSDVSLAVSNIGCK